MNLNPGTSVGLITYAAYPTPGTKVDTISNNPAVIAPPEPEEE